MLPSWCRERGSRRVGVNSIAPVLVLLARRSDVNHMRGMAQRISGSFVTRSSRFDTTKAEAEGVPPWVEKYLVEGR